MTYGYQGTYDNESHDGKDTSTFTDGKHGAEKDKYKNLLIKTHNHFSG